MRAQVVHHHYIADFSTGLEQMFHVGQENVGVGGLFDRHRATMSLRLMAPRIVMIFQWAENRTARPLATRLQLPQTPLQP